MKFIFEPTVYLVGKQQVVNEEVSRFLKDHEIEGWSSDATSPAEQLVEIGGRLCYMSFNKPRPGGNSSYIHHIKEVGHGSVTEHTSWTFIIVGISRSLTHELVRHRHFNFSQLSQRYVDESECNFVVPHEIQKEVQFYLNNRTTEERSIFGTPEYDCGYMWVAGVEHLHGLYINLTNYLFNKLVPPAYIDLRLGEDGPISLSVEEMMKKLPLEKRTELRKIARQTARSLLPNATETKIQLTVNARSLRNLLELRGSSHAETEIRVLSNKILDIIVKDSPALFGDYEKILLEDGTHELVTKYKKI